MPRTFHPDRMLQRYQKLLIRKGENHDKLNEMQIDDHYRDRFHMGGRHYSGIQGVIMRKAPILPRRRLSSRVERIRRERLIQRVCEVGTLIVLFAGSIVGLIIGYP